MKHVIRFLARLYPTSWRRRYAREFDALLEDTRPDWRNSLDILKGALGMQMQTWNVAKMLVLTGVAGALVGLAGSFALPVQYVSTAVVKIGPQQTPAGPVVPTKRATAEYINRLEEQVLSPSSLTSVIWDHSLYQSERARMPIEDVIEMMRKNISLLPVRTTIRGSQDTNAFIIRFVSNDPATTQTVTQDLIRGFIEQNVRSPFGPTSMTLELLDSAGLPRKRSPNRALIATVGLAAGLAVGGIRAGRRRSPKAA